ncbi:hypothetical protein IJ674_09605 [bacterium]|nr:hypothetical protein [bacterium]
MTDLLTQEQIDAITDAFAKLADAIRDVIQDLVEKVIKPLVDNLISYFKSFSNSRVKHLAYHAKKYRTRKKNLHRMQKDFIRLLSG